MNASVLPPRHIRFHITKVDKGFRATCPAFPGYSRPGDTEEAARDELERVLLEALAGKPSGSWLKSNHKSKKHPWM